MNEQPDEEIPRLPRGRHFRVPGGVLYRLVFMTLLLVGILVFGRTCAQSTASFVNSFDPPPAAPPETITTPEGEATLIPLQGKTDEEIRQMIEAARKRAAERAGRPSQTPAPATGVVPPAK